MNNKSTKRIFALFFTINLAMICTYGYLFFVMKSKNAKTSELFVASHSRATDKEKNQGLERMLKDTETERKKLSEYFITKKNAVSFIEQMEKIGKSAHVALSVNSVSDEAKDTGVINLNFSVMGSFSNIFRFIELVDTVPYKVTIKKMDIQAVNDQKEENLKWSGSFTVMLESFVMATATTTMAENTGSVNKK